MKSIFAVLLFMAAFSSSYAQNNPEMESITRQLIPALEQKDWGRCSWDGQMFYDKYEKFSVYESLIYCENLVTDVQSSFLVHFYPEKDQVEIRGTTWGSKGSGICDYKPSYNNGLVTLDETACTIYKDHE